MALLIGQCSRSETVSKAKDLFRRKPPSLCHCFAAGTLIWTPVGLVPIEQVSVGDFVLTLNESTGDPEFQPVMAVIPTEQTALLELTYTTEDGRVEVLQTADAHPIWHIERSWTRADALNPGDEVRVIEGTARVVSLEFTGRRVTVFDLSVKGNTNYLVGPAGVWVHNCVPFGMPTNFKAAKQAAQASGGQVHHLIEKRHFKRGTMQGNPDKFPVVPLSREEHQLVTNRLRAEMPFDGSTYTIGQLRDAYQRVYPLDWWSAIEPHLR